MHLILILQPVLNALRQRASERSYVAGIRRKAHVSCAHSMTIFLSARCAIIKTDRMRAACAESAVATAKKTMSSSGDGSGPEGA
jgi:hypothetical protein